MAGKWLYRGKSDSVHAPCDTHPYGEQLFCFRDEQGPSDANLSLILAAPEMLDALKYALPYLEACVPNPRNGHNADGSIDVNCVDRARAAIAKAEGRADG